VTPAAIAIMVALISGSFTVLAVVIPLVRKRLPAARRAEQEREQREQREQLAREDGIRRDRLDASAAKTVTDNALTAMDARQAQIDKTLDAMTREIERLSADNARLHGQVDEANARADRADRAAREATGRADTARARADRADLRANNCEERADWAEGCIHLLREHLREKGIDTPALPPAPVPKTTPPPG